MKTGFRCGQLLSCYFQKKSRFTLFVSYPKKKISTVCRFSLFCFVLRFIAFLPCMLGFKSTNAQATVVLGGLLHAERHRERQRQRERERETDRERQRHRETQTERE